jgi:hypothetical protein
MVILAHVSVNRRSGALSILIADDKRFFVTIPEAEIRLIISLMIP